MTAAQQEPRAPHIPMAIAYDFDGTLSPGNMQEYDFIPAVGMQPDEFWTLANDSAKRSDGDPVLAYLNLMLERARAAQQAVRREDFERYGKTVGFFPGVSDWFARVNAYAAQRGVALQHAIISSGIREMIQGTEIAAEFAHIFASAFMYDANGVAVWPALAVNYTNKTQYLFRINKGTPDVWDNSLINRYVAQDERAVPFSNMVFIGDGSTDVPCMRLVKEQGGHSIAVFEAGKQASEQVAVDLVRDQRVNMTAPADYRAGSKLERQVRAIIDKLVADASLAALR